MFFFIPIFLTLPQAGQRPPKPENSGSLLCKGRPGFHNQIVLAVVIPFVQSCCPREVIPLSRVYRVEFAGNGTAIE
jgi:hypothetical protein